MNMLKKILSIVLCAALLLGCLPAAFAEEDASAFGMAERLSSVLDDPEMPDFEYDRKLRRLEELEAEHPELAREDSPTKRVGGAVLSDFQEVVHPVPLACRMYSRWKN